MIYDFTGSYLSALLQFWQAFFSCRRQTYLPDWYVNVSTCTQPAAAACYCCLSSRLVLSCRWNPCLSHKISSANAMFTNANTWMITTQSWTLLTRFHISVHAAPFCVNHLMLFHCFSEITPLAHDVKLATVKIRIWVSEGFFIGRNRRTHKTKYSYCVNLSKRLFVFAMWHPRWILNRNIHEFD